MLIGEYADEHSGGNGDIDSQVKAIQAAYGVTPLLEANTETEETEETGLRKWGVVCNHYIHTYTLCKELRCLPRAGGLDDQDWVVVEAFGVISQEYNRLKSEALKKAQKR